jgi:hypothetical protein
MRALYFKVPRKVRLFVLLLIMVFLAYFVGRFLLAKTKTVPGEFMQARQEASLVAIDIVSMSKDSAKHIDEISALNSGQKYPEALALVKDELNRNREIRDKAIALSSYLQTMTMNVSSIKPRGSAETALEAVSTEVTLIGHLLTYNDHLNQLLEIIRGRITGDPEASSQDVSDLVKKINDESVVVNALNETFNDKMNEFDRGF